MISTYILQQMLPIFAAAGRGQYAKALRLYLELMLVYNVKYGSLIKTSKSLAYILCGTRIMSGLEFELTSP